MAATCLDFIRRGHVWPCTCLCWCVRVFVWWHFHRETGQGLSVINTSRWIPSRCEDMCVYSAVWRAKVHGRREGDACYLGLSCYVDAVAEMYLVYVIMNKGFGVLILFKHRCLRNKWADWQESENPGGLVWGNVFLGLFARKWLEFLVLNMPNE